jgi:hypothetical protein
MERGMPSIFTRHTRSTSREGKRPISFRTANILPHIEEHAAFGALVASFCDGLHYFSDRERIPAYLVVEPIRPTACRCTFHRRNSAANASRFACFCACNEARF